MAVLRRFPGADAVLVAHGTALPQPDQLCGPFSARLALHALLDSPPSVTELALAAGTRIWPQDVASWRPTGAPLDRTGWDRLPRAPGAAGSGTDATGLTAGVLATCPGVAVVPVSGADRSGLASLLRAVADLEHPVGVLAHLRTGPVAPPGLTWDVGHFVVLWGLAEDRVAVADTYAELGAPGLPPGCRMVGVSDLARALPERGLLLLVPAECADDVRALVPAAGLTAQLWTT